MSLFIRSGLWAHLALLCGLLMCHPSAVMAQDLKGIGDPTRPPPGAMVVQNGAEAASAGTPAAPGAAASGVDGTPGKGQPSQPVLTLQAIRFAIHGGAGVALINDQIVEVGDKVGHMTLLSVSRNVAVLKGPSGVRRLTLLPDMQDMNEQSATVSAGTARRGRKESK